VKALQQYADRKAMLAIGWAQKRSERLELAGIEEALFGALFRLPFAYETEDIGRIGRDIGAAQRKLAAVIGHLPEHDSIRLLSVFVEQRCRSHFEQIATLERQAGLEVARLDFAEERRPEG
jgi:hypothetical protein